MPDYQYTARQTSGQQTTGILSAANEQDALSSLAARSLFPIQIGLAESTKAQEIQSRRRVPVRYVTMFFTQLADLLRSGVSLLRSLQLLERQSTHGGLQYVIRDVSEKVADGNPLAEALGRHPKVFGALAVSMVRAGEEGSFLEDVLKRISGFQEHQEELKGRVVGAMVYPVFLLTAGTAIVVWMLVQFVPKFSGIFDRMAADGQLPWATSTLLGISDTMQRYWPLCLVAIVAAAFLLFYWSRSESGRVRVDHFWLKAYGLGPIVRSLALARFTRILGTLLQNGVPVLHSLRIAKDAAGNVILSQAIGATAESVSSGKSLAEPLRASDQFPAEIVEMIAVGEEANNLEQVLIDIADNLERRTNRRLELFVRLLEPIMLLIMAALVVFVIAALLLPVLQMSGIF